ncbi:hypothetical protein DFH06DRAFT_72825 [Mycena polygramma]|nr:hypothetical protein DFH06DRAFT_72825 [Mycena polygramma]
MGSEQALYLDTGCATSISTNVGIARSEMFSGAHNFTIAGQAVFNNITKNYAVASVPSDYRMIPLGDIDLQREICLDNKTSVVSRRRPGFPGRRVYSAKFKGQNVTVAIYQGPGTEEKWRQYMRKYTSLRHPNIIQIYRAASLGGIHATVFHDGLIPFAHCTDLYKDFPCLTVYIYGCCNEQFMAANNYLYSIFRRFTFSSECTIWIRLSTGQLCVDLVHADSPTYFGYSSLHPISDAMTLFSGPAPSMEVTAINTLILEDYHNLCYSSLAHHSSIVALAAVSVTLGVVSCQNGFAAIATLPDTFVRMCRWDSYRNGRATILENGSTRLNCRDIVGRTLSLECGHGHPKSWLSQANHIFQCCQVTSNFEDYICVDNILFNVGILPTTVKVPAGFLFLCPEKDFRTGPSSFNWPNLPAYWSLDPSGARRLSTEESVKLGFPALQFSTEVSGLSWDSSVYLGLRKFHEGKGFDPFSQQVARHLGHKLYRPRADLVNPPFAHVHDVETDVQDSPMDVADNATEEHDAKSDSSGMDLSW